MRTSIDSLQQGMWVKFETDDLSGLDEEQRDIYSNDNGHIFLVIDRDDFAFDEGRSFLVDKKQELYDFCPRMGSLNRIQLVMNYRIIPVSLDEVIGIYGQDQTLSIYIDAQKHIERINKHRDGAAIKQIEIPPLFGKEVMVRALARPTKFSLALDEIKELPPESRLEYLKKPYKNGRNILQSQDLYESKKIGLILNLLPYEQRLGIITESIFLFGRNMLQMAVADDDIEALKSILINLKKQDRYYAILAVRESRKSIWASEKSITFNSLQEAVHKRNFVALEILLNELPKEELLEIIQRSFKNFDRLDPKAFKIINELLPKIDPVSFSEKKVSSLDSLLQYLIQVQPSDYLDFITKAEIKFDSETEIINGLMRILPPFYDDDKELLVDAMLANADKFFGEDVFLYGLKVAIDVAPKRYSEQLSKDSFQNYTHALTFFKRKKSEKEGMGAATDLFYRS